MDSFVSLQFHPAMCFFTILLSSLISAGQIGFPAAQPALPGWPLATVRSPLLSLLALALWLTLMLSHASEVQQRVRNLLLVNFGVIGAL